MDEINIDDFTKLDLRVAKITSAEAVEDADKLIKINLNIGDFGEKTVFAGIKKFYNPQDLIGKLVVCVNNLKNREMKFGTSEGMILASSNDEGVFLIGSDSGAKPGDKVT
jgi:methionyl-tRNA synthetase